MGFSKKPDKAKAIPAELAGFRGFFAAALSLAKKAHISVTQQPDVQAAIRPSALRSMIDERIGGIIRKARIITYGRRLD
jgi:hypothetical protein